MRRITVVFNSIQYKRDKYEDDVRYYVTWIPDSYTFSQLKTDSLDFFNLTNKKNYELQDRNGLAWKNSLQVVFAIDSTLNCNDNEIYLVKTHHRVR